MLGEKSKEVGSIVSIITEIASQTNLLIASIIGDIQRDTEKAIHVMSQGDVADEVSKRTQEMSGQINEPNNGTVSVVEFLEGIAHVSRMAAENTQSVVASVQEQTASMKQITTASKYTRRNGRRAAAFHS
ncbi:hypothetical protein [Brevibacillus fortis]|uniref:hypothetical protein n=1 Tax=Brevibacillus fortis TaxID=2126352 RepID=UPI0038FCDB0D